MLVHKLKTKKKILSPPLSNKSYTLQIWGICLLVQGLLKWHVVEEKGKH